MTTVRGHRDDTPSKTSLNFICAPGSGFEKHSNKSVRNNLENLPRDVVSLIAYHLVVDDTGVGQHPSPLIPLFLTSRRTYEVLCFEQNPKLYYDLYKATFDHAALTRRYDWMIKHLSDVAGRGRKVYDLFGDPKSWATEYKSRWELSWLMREVGRLRKLDIPGFCDTKEVEAALWSVWFLVTENDGKNIHFLYDRCNWPEFQKTFYLQDMLRDSLVPGYPRETGAKSLGAWTSLLSGIDSMYEDTPARVDEKIFVCRPYVFACAKYDVTYAPWNHRRLPLPETERREDHPEVTMRSKALPYQRFGYEWRRAPPHMILGMFLTFARLLERQPGRMGLKPGSSSFNLAPGEDSQPGLFSVTRILPSIYHDREWQRNSKCQDPFTSPGLPPLTFRGEIEGYWRGKFLFYDFDMYRQILAGNMRGVYTGTFAEQAAEMEFKETIIKIRHEDVGGHGPTLCAGFDAEVEGASEEEQRRIEGGYGYELCKNDAEPDEEGWTKEILISGRCRTSWGWAKVRGRVRSWDGLIILAIAYSRHAMGRWLWRGYIHTGGYVLGRWRDTFTDENLRGYEGGFGMVRAGDVFYPSHYPTKFEDSLGVNSGSPLQPIAPTGISLPLPQASPAPSTYTHTASPSRPLTPVSIVEPLPSHKRSVLTKGQDSKVGPSIDARAISAHPASLLSDDVPPDPKRARITSDEEPQEAPARQAWFPGFEVFARTAGSGGGRRPGQAYRPWQDVGGVVAPTKTELRPLFSTKEASDPARKTFWQPTRNDLGGAGVA